MEGQYEVRTDLALEAHQQSQREAARLSGVTVEEQHCHNIPVTTVKITSREAAEKLDKPRGCYITLELEQLLKHGQDVPEVLFLTLLLVAVGLLSAPALLVMNGLTMMKKESRSLPNLLSLFLGIFVGTGELAVLLTVIIFAMPEETGLGAFPSSW